MAPVTLREWKRRSGISGLAIRDWRRMKATSRSARDDEAADRARVDPAPLGDLQDREDAEHQRDGDQGGAGEVGALLEAEPVRIVDQPQRQPADEDPDRQVDDEDEVPGDRLGEDAAEQQADRAAGRGDEAVDADRFRLVGGLREHRHDHPQDHRRGERAADPLDEAGADQDRLRRRGRAEQRGGGEDRQPDEEDAALAEQVAEPAGEQQQAAEGDQVGVDDPGQARLREAEVVLDRGQGDVDDGRRRGRSSASPRRGRRGRSSGGCRRPARLAPVRLQSGEWLRWRSYE